MSAAELLIGERGIRGVSLRQISEASGSRNIAAAQYHFGTLDNLVQEIMIRGKERLDHLRERLYREINLDFSHMSTAEFVSLIVRPHLLLTDDAGRRSFARFLKAAQQDYGYYELWFRLYRTSPFANAILAGLRATLAGLPEHVWSFRVTTMGKLIVSAIVDFDASQSPSHLSERAFVAELIEMVTAAFSASAILEDGEPARSNGARRGDLSTQLARRS